MHITIHTFWFVFLGFLAIIAFLYHNGFSLNLFSKHDNSIIDKFLNKYPDVAPEFMKKGLKEQNIENNQEIHEINKRFDKIETELEDLKDITEKLTKILEEIEKRG